MRDGLRAFSQDIERRSKPASHHIGQRKSAEQRDQHGKRQGQGVDARQPVTRQLQFLIVPINPLHGVGIMRQTRRNRLRQLQDARLFEHATSADRHQNAQIEFAAIAFDGAHQLRAARLLQLRLTGQIG